MRADGEVAAHVQLGSVDAAGDRDAGRRAGRARLDGGAAGRHGAARPDPVDPRPDAPPAPGRELALSPQSSAALYLVSMYIQNA